MKSACRRFYTVLVLFFMPLLTGCASHRLSEFQLYDGNETLPPEHQRVEIIRGAINNNKIDIHFSKQVGQNKKEGDLTLTGKEFDKYSQMIRSTSLKGFQPLMGADSFDVTFYYADGQSTNGEPSNPAAWREFESFIEKQTEQTSSKE